MPQSVKYGGVVVARPLDGVTAVDRTSLEAVTSRPREQVEMEVRDRVPVDLVVEFLRTQARV